MKWFAFALAAGWGAAYGQPPAAPVWPDTFLGRVEALAVVEALQAELLASRSATVTLERWCWEHRLADEPVIRAVLVRTEAEKPITAEQRQRLEVAPDEEIRYRRVRLQCGQRVLSEADNWYVPGRLTPEMNRLLETTDTPFGRAVQSLEPYRRTFQVDHLWRPLPAGWEMDTAATTAPAGNGLFIPGALFAHHAVLYRQRDHKPFSEVNEVYQRALLAFGPPTPAPAR